MDIKDINFAIEILSHPQEGDASDIKEAFQIAIESLKAYKEALNQEPKRVPVSDRLPDNSGEYLVSVTDDIYENGDYQYVGVAWFSHIIDHAIVRSEWHRLEMGEKVVAWMPLPEPCKSRK